MTPATLDKYRRILQADPRSRIFVELGRALLEIGDAAEAAQVCERGLTHHRDSVQGRALLCRALLAAGRRDDAADRIAEALAAEPLHPSVHEVVIEALGAGLGPALREPLERAAQATSDRRLRRFASEAAGAAPEGVTGTEGGSAVTGPEGCGAGETPAEGARADGAAPARGTPGSPVNGAPSGSPGPTAGSGAPAESSAPPALQGASPTAAPGARRAVPARPSAAPRRPVARMIVRGPETVEAHLPGEVGEGGLLDSEGPLPTPLLRGTPAPDARPRLVPPPPPEAFAPAPVDPPLATVDPFAPPPPASPDPFAPPAPPPIAPQPRSGPLAPPPVPAAPPARRDPGTASRPLEPSVLDLLPAAQAARAPRENTRGLGMLRPETVQSAAPATAAVREEEEEKTHEAVRTYEHELRMKLAATVPEGRFLRRHAWAAAAVVLLLVAAGSAGAYALVRSRHRVGDAQAAVAAARQGLARDTVGALREASRVLAGARRMLTGPDDGGAAVLQAEVAALLAHDHGDGPAAALARGLVDGGLRGPGAAGVRYLLAPADEAKSAAAALLERAGGGTPLERALAGEVLLGRRELGAAEKHLAAAAGATPPSMRAVCDLGQLELLRGDPAAALARFELVLRAVPKHPGAAVGAGEAQLALHGDTQGALRTVEAALQDPASQPPQAARLRAELVRARLLAATGRTSDAEARLDEAGAREPGSPEVEAARADVRAAAGDLDGAVQAASGALERNPGSLAARERLADLQVRRELWRPVLTTADGGKSRSLHLSRGIALLALGDAGGARSELEATRSEGRMTAEAAAWMALAELAAGRRAQATSIVSVLLSAPQPHAVALLARARLDLAGGDAAAAERNLRAALARDPELAIARRDLARLLLDRRRPGEAREVIDRLLASSPWDAEARHLSERAAASERGAPAATPDRSLRRR